MSRLDIEQPDYEHLNSVLAAALSDLIRIAKTKKLHLEFDCAVEINRAEDALKKARTL